MKVFLAISLICGLLFSNAYAQFTGPTTRGAVSTVEQARGARIDSYVTVTGHIVSHLRKNYYTFQDETGEIRVEIEPEAWRNRKVGPNNTVRLLAEVDRNAAGDVYLWVKSLEVVQ